MAGMRMRALASHLLLKRRINVCHMAVEPERADIYNSGTGTRPGTQVHIADLFVISIAVYVQTEIPAPQKQSKLMGDK